MPNGVLTQQDLEARLYYSRIIEFISTLICQLRHRYISDLFDAVQLTIRCFQQLTAAWRVSR